MPSVFCNDDQELSTQRTLANLKRGHDGLPNLRKKYIKRADIVDDDAFELWKSNRHPDQDQLTITLTQRNAFHMADDGADAINSFKSIYDKTPSFFIPNELTHAEELATLTEHLGTQYKP